MRMCRWAAGVALIVCAAANGAEPYAARTAVAVASVYADWKDGVRGVVVPVKVYFPRDVAARPAASVPVIIFSHGLGGSRDNYVRWGEYWAGQGYVMVHPTHVGSDTSVLLEGAGQARGRLGDGSAARGAMENLVRAANFENSQRRVKDVSFILDHLEKLQAGTLPVGDRKGLEPLEGKLDLKHIGMAGHSFGAQTTLRIAGQNAGGIGARAEANGAGEPRITAAIAMSPQPAMLGSQQAAFGGIKIPMMHLTGTEDHSPPALGDVKPADRRVPFDNMPGPAMLIIFKGATHMTFGGARPGAGAAGGRVRELLGQAPSTLTPQKEEAIHALIERSTAAFWDAYLREEPAAKVWLAGELPKAVGESGTVEMRGIAPAVR